MKNKLVNCFLSPSIAKYNCLFPTRRPNILPYHGSFSKTVKLFPGDVMFHYEFEFIHPFSDGNVRTERLWQSLIFGRLSPVFEHLPVENMAFSNQQRYYDAIIVSTAAGQSGPFIDFMLTEIRDTLEKHKATEKFPNKVPDKVPNKSELRVLDLLLESPSITASAIAAEIGITDRAVRKIISSLKEQRLVERVGSNKSGYWKVNR